MVSTKKENPPNSVGRTTTEFEKRLSTLNKEQLQAVQEIDGPVMVIAGPGTGKTEVLGMRTANILKKTQMRPSNILCLTFSNTGAKAMRERLRKIIGPDAYGVTVSTVHSFCNELIQQNPQLFIDFRALEQVSNLDQLKIVRRAIKNLGSGSPLYNPVSDHDRSADVLSRITEMKKEGLLPDDLKEFVSDYAEEIKTTPTGRERDLESKSYKGDLKKVQQFKDFITIYEKYIQELAASNRYDFDDMVLVVLDALKENEWLLLSLQERYQYILVDEFQDLNGAQNRVLDMLTSYVHTDLTPNIFAVGDDDQAIFRFQGANIGNMQSFVSRFVDTKVITLTTNYRSTQPILDAASNVIDANEERLVKVLEGLNKDLVSAKAEEGEMPEFIRFPDTSTQYAGIVDILRKAEKGSTPWKEMAIICRKNEEVLEISDVLSAAGIPNIVTAKQDLTQHPQVLQTVTLLRSILEPTNSVELSGAIALPCFNCHPADLGRLWIAFRSHNREQKKMSLHEYILETETLPQSIKDANEFIISKHNSIPSTTITALVAETLTESNLLPPEDAEVADPRAIAGIHAFYEYVKSRCYEVKSLTLRILLSDIDEYLAEPRLKLQYDLPHLVQDGVQLMTAHGAKGLEFDLVVMMNVWFRNWGNRNRGSTLSLPDHLIMDLDKEVEKRAGQEDERRLFFVAMTRARSKLFLTFPETYRSSEQMKQAQVSTFVAEAAEKVNEIVLTQEQLPQPIETLRMPELKIDEAFKAFLLERLKDYELSVTALNAFLSEDNGPQKFLWEQLLQKPSDKKAAMAFGTAVHGALEDRNFSWQEGKEYKTDKLVEGFLKHLEKEILTDEEREHYKSKGGEIVRKYGDETSTGIPLVLSTERTIHAVVDDVPIKGKVDRIDLFEPRGRKCRVLDYKTGNTCRTEDAVRKKEGLFRQLVFYKMLCDSDPKFIHDATLFTLDFIGKEDQTRREIDVEITQQEVEDLKVLIKEVWGKIQRLEFGG
ncbi:ATP-dependent helicase [Candidatus Peregrinibacteria bacterium]|jgi:DNA helicase II / ATP-dependent DNA helicase PcrA|nr:ATP-dependent helicase [Candidatus Peregrinibacteria bacterium]MBT3598642.1 ATP-dependent helicase [Candidatus Peregrinibacteria bacterium]MBT6730959.1 ATP-dependent helicase [Candidatus Peregrinibacteria bacterium]MBT7009900.1 ATP-dependent helicase [Candidatus Peregrinibacteria bacterium]MBT7344701.1 ATP-dependent helicase [Candidatus Peregrinibacteria bacterium]